MSRDLRAVPGDAAPVAGEEVADGDAVPRGVAPRQAVPEPVRGLRGTREAQLGAVVVVVVVVAVAIAVAAAVAAAQLRLGVRVLVARALRLGDVVVQVGVHVHVAGAGGGAVGAGDQVVLLDHVGLVLVVDLVLGPVVDSRLSPVGAPHSLRHQLFLLPGRPVAPPVILVTPVIVVVVVVVLLLLVLLIIVAAKPKVGIGLRYIIVQVPRPVELDIIHTIAGTTTDIPPIAGDPGPLTTTAVLQQHRVEAAVGSRSAGSLGLSQLLSELLAPQGLLVLLGLAALLAQLVQRLGDPGGLQPGAAEAADVLAPAREVLLVGAQAGERRLLDQEVAVAAAAADAVAAATVVLVLVVGVVVIAVVVVVIGPAGRTDAARDVVVGVVVAVLEEGAVGVIAGAGPRDERVPRGGVP